MEELTIQSATEAVRLNPVQQSTSSKLNDDRLKRNEVPQEENHKGSVHKQIAGEDAKKLVNEVSQIVNKFSTKISFTLDAESKHPMILVKDRETGAVIRQIPPKEMLELRKKMEEIAGIIYNGRV